MIYTIKTVRKDGELKKCLFRKPCEAGDKNCWTQDKEYIGECVDGDSYAQPGDTMPYVYQNTMAELGEISPKVSWDVFEGLIIQENDFKFAAPMDKNEWIRKNYKPYARDSYYQLGYAKYMEAAAVLVLLKCPNCNTFH